MGNKNLVLRYSKWIMIKNKKEIPKYNKGTIWFSELKERNNLSGECFKSSSIKYL